MDDAGKENHMSNEEMNEPERSDEINGQLVSGDANALAGAIRDALGIGPDEPVSVYAPPHKARLDGKTVNRFPLNASEFEALRQKSRAELIDLGLRPWDESGLLLFPMEWYPLIPDGFEIVDISGNAERFEAGKTDDDCRFGVLAYGIVCKDEANG